MIKNVLPIKLAQNYLVSTIKESIGSEMAEMKRQIKHQLDLAHRDAEEKLKDCWNNSSQEQLAVVIEPLKRAMEETRDPQRETQLKNTLKELTKLAAQIS